MNSGQDDHPLPDKPDEDVRGEAIAAAMNSGEDDPLPDKADEDVQGEVIGEMEDWPCTEEEVENRLFGPLFSLKASRFYGASECNPSKEGRARVSNEEFNVAKGPAVRSSRMDSGGNGSLTTSSSYPGHHGRLDSLGRGSFKCNALCLQIPGLSKRKPSRASTRTINEQGTRVSMVSSVISLQKFDCDSQLSEMMLEEDGGQSMFFDLPVELIRSSCVDMDSPVNAAFVFGGGDPDRSSKKRASYGAPKRGSSSASASSSSRSSDNCITPPVPRARDELEGYLEAHSA